MAYGGFGVWALVTQSLMVAIVRMIVLWLQSSWKPLLVFSMTSFNQLFSFGSKILVSGMINTIYTNIYSLVIGKAFAASQLGLFNRADKFATLPAGTFTQIITKDC